MKKLRLGVLGCSHHYEIRIAPALKKSTLIEPYAVASRNEKKARAFAEKLGFAKSYGSYQELLADRAVDLVYIPLPNNLHLEYIKRCADAKKPVICEKPLTLNASEAVAAAIYCRQKRVPLMEAFMYRFHPQWMQARQIIAEGNVGEVLAVHGHFSFANFKADDIRNQPETGGGALYDIGCYAISSARFLMAREPQRVICLIHRDPNFQTDVLSSAILDFGNGRTATFTVSTQMFPFQRVAAIGSGGCLRMELPFNMYPDVPAKIVVAGGLGERVVKTEIADQYLLEFEGFANAVINKTEVPTPISDAVANMAVIDALFQSAANGQWAAVKNHR